MKQLLAVPLTITFYICFALILLFFHLMQVITYYLMGYQAHKTSVDWLNLFMMNTPRILGSKIEVKGIDNLPVNRSIIIVSNHQSMMDIPPIIWLLRKHHVKFVAKKELSNWVPSISFNLKKGGSLLIDRKKGTETVRQIADYAQKLKEKGHSVCIFPEGTRSRNGNLKEFKAGGLQSLVTNSGGIPVVPFVVHGNYKMFYKGLFPLQVTQPLLYEILPPILEKEQDAKTITETCRNQISTAMQQNEATC
ncbi:MAG: lysophospholipid acyltransferase family protein [Cyclobacteriaceae bacterium]